MNLLSLEPNLIFLLMKTACFLAVLLVTGWAVHPDPVFKESRISTWVFQQSLGAGVLLLAGFNLVAFDIPAKWVCLVPVILSGTRLMLNKLRRPQYFGYALSCEAFTRSLLIYSLGTIFIVGIYLVPFIAVGSSGLYAYGGGDHSSYFRVSDLVIEHSLKDIMISWGLEWPPKKDYVGMTATAEMYPPTPNWSINQFLFYIRYARQSMTFANQTIGVPFIAMGFFNSEESYTAGVAVLLSLLCWSAAVFTSSFLQTKTPAKWLAYSACAVALASPAMSLVLKQTIPAVYAWGSMLIFLSVLMRKIKQNDSPIGLPIPFGVAFASTYLMYLPAIFVSGPLWAYLISKRAVLIPKSVMKWLLLVLLFLVAATNYEIDRPAILFFSNAIGAILDYGIKPSALPPTILGVADFESISSGVASFWLTSFAAIVVAIGFVFFLVRQDSTKTHILVFILPICLVTVHYWTKGGQYHVIRMVEFLGVVIIAMSTMGFAGRWSKTKLDKLFICLTTSTFLISSVQLKIAINKKIINAAPEPRAAMLTASDVRLAAQLSKEFEKSERQPSVYWMGWGAISFANNEILFRKQKYIEAFEYDYTFVNLDIISPELLNDAVLVYPAANMVDILRVDESVLANKKIPFDKRVIQYIGVGEGAAIIGTGWMPPTVGRGKLVRYLRPTMEGGVVIWADQDKKVQVEVEASAVVPGTSLTLRKPESEYKFTLSHKTILRKEHEDGQEYFARLRGLVASDGGALDFIHRLEKEFSNKLSLSASEMNAQLLNNKNLRPFIWHCIENNISLTSDLTKTYKSQQLTFPLNGYLEPNPTIISFNIDLHAGANVVRFIVRDIKGRRSGRDPASGIPYNSATDASYVVVRKIGIKEFSPGVSEL